ncbi:MAG: hypothetical protein PHQ59_04370 [Candidatus Daviesbacteria bacterium]|nr:hypothetical protein [Candidatus Daviesbacteria bacterium]
MIFFLIFVLEILFLFLFSRSLTNSLARLLYRISHSRIFTYNALAVIFLPGTLVHELAHMLIAGMFLVPSGEISIFPEIDGDEVRFGSIKIAETEPVKRFFIGAAPIIFGMFIILALLFTSLQFYSSETPWWQLALVVFVVFEIANTMFSSKKDMEGALALFIVTFIILFSFFGALYFSNLLIPFLNWLGALHFPNLSELFKVFSLLLLIPITIDLLFIFIAKMLKA